MRLSEKERRRLFEMSLQEQCERLGTIGSTLDTNHFQSRAPIRYMREAGGQDWIYYKVQPIHAWWKTRRRGRGER
jgi:hypothetical protein